MKRVVTGEQITSQHFSARWYNSTLEKPTIPSTPRKRSSLPRHGELMAFCTDPPVARFDPVGLDSRFDTYGERVDRTHNVSVAALNEYNWIIPQAAMSTNARSQPCVYFGITYANVLVEDETHNFVTLDPNTKKLVSSDHGKGQILVGAATGQQVLFISIGNMGSGGGVRLVRFKLNGSLEEGSAEADFLSMSGDEIETDTLLDPEGIFAELDTDGTGLAIYQDNEYYIIQAHCPPEEEETTTTTEEESTTTTPEETTTTTETSGE